MKRRSHHHLPKCVYWHHGAYWHKKNGKCTRLSENLSEALAEYARLHEGKHGSMVWLINQAMPHIKRRVKPNTARQYEIAARKLRKILKDFKPEQVKPKHVAQIKRQLAETPNMTNRVLSVLRLVFDFAVEEQLVSENPATGIKRLPERKRKRLLSMEEYRAIYAAAGPRLQVILDLLRYTGQRVQDVLQIRRSALTEEGICFQQMKTDARLIVRWTPNLRAVVERAKGLTGTNVVSLTLLRNRFGKAPDYGSVVRQFREACKAAGVEDAQQRDLRAFSLTHAKREGKNPTALAGHTSAAMTVRYLRDRDAPVVDGPDFPEPETP